MNEAAGMSMANARMKKTIIGQSIQPLVLTAAVMSMFILFQARMVPIFEKIKPVAAWPSGAVRLYNISYFIEHYLLLVVAAMVGMGYVFLVSLPRWKGPRRAMVDTMPPWSVYRVQQSSAFLIALSSLMTAGVTVYASLQLLHRNGSPYLRWHLERMMSAMSQGADNPGAAMNTGLLDKETAGEVEDYSQLGSFREAIQTIGKQNLEDSLERIALTMGALRNVMLIAVAGTVMWIYGTTYMLQADIANSAGSASGAAGVPH
jgi:type II secretory pathway component PulF